MFAVLLILPLVGASNTHGQLLRSEEIQAPATCATEPFDCSGEATNKVNKGSGVSCSGNAATCDASTCCEAAATTYVNLGDGNCRDKPSTMLYPASYYQLVVHTEATCKAQCDADSACEAFTIITTAGTCIIFGAAITSASTPTGWTYESGNGGGDITTTMGTPGRYCMKKNEATLTCTSCPDDDGGCSENTPYIDNRLGVCVAFCTGDEVPQRVAGKGINVKSCTSCPPPGEPTKLYADHENHTCVSTCPPGKAPNEKGACAVCKPPYSYADHVNKKCVAKCPPGKVPDTLAGNDCKECEGEFPYADHERHACVKQCGPGKVGHLLTQECRTCETGKYANHKNHSCDTDCPLDHPYKDGLDCVMTCSEGKVPKPMGVGDPFICSFCPSGKFADHAKHECVETCSTGYTPDPDGTLDPMYKNDCKRCPLGKFADHEVKACVVDCPNGTTKNAAKRNCDGPGAAPCMPVYVPVPKPVPVYITPAPPVPAPTPTV